jgi:hypothetical protein
VVIDLPSFHIGCPLPEGFGIIGPVLRTTVRPRMGAPRNWTWTSSA